jgi:CIC family chloride channel protein
LILFEMTGDYDMILPLMVAVVTAMLVGRVFEAESIYTLKLKRLGLRSRLEPETALLTSTPISEIMTRKVTTIPADFPIGKLGRHFNKIKLAGFPVVDAQGELVGMVTYTEAQTAYTADPPPSPDLPVEKIMRGPGAPLYPDDFASTAVRRMAQTGADRLPVVSRKNTRKLLGIISQRDLMELYARRISADD